MTDKNMARRVSFLMGLDGKIAHVTDTPSADTHLSEMKEAVGKHKAGGLRNRRGFKWISNSSHYRPRRPVTLLPLNHLIHLTSASPCSRSPAGHTTHQQPATKAPVKPRVREVEGLW